MSDSKLGVDVIGTIALSWLLVIVGTIADDATVGLLLCPIVYLLWVFVMLRAPLRFSAMALMFLALTLQDASDHSAAEKFDPPFAGLGAILFSHLNTVGKSLGFGWASMSGMDLLIVALLVIAIARSRSELKRANAVPTPRPLVQLAYVALLSIAWVWLFGMVRGGDFGKSLWQLNRVMYLPVIFLLFHLSLRGPQDLPGLLKVVLVSGVYKSLLALYVVFTVVLPPDEQTGSTKPAWATSHQDSILFAVAFVAVLAILLERAVPRRSLKYYAMLLPILGCGTWANNRRMAWVQVILVFLTVYLVSDSANAVKKKINRLLYVVAPVVAVYIAVGWNYGGLGRTFKPVRMLRSVIDPSTDASTLWRELENYNIIMTFRKNPIFGSGYGHPYDEIIQLPAVNYDLEFYSPHNSLLGLWAYSGVIGYAGLTMLWVVGVYFAMRTYKGSREPRLRAGALVCFGTVLVYLIQCWGDLGLGTWVGVFCVAPALAVAGKLATAAGQWAPVGSGKRNAH
jgi:O-antigen ligase/polysaccharide polymerase Wzy-like membrane protein